ncbi:MAG: hypothetical protein RRY40_01445, partial [Oscillospiraceae bacterium]
MSVIDFPWSALPDPIFHPKELRPRKKWVTYGGWFLSFALIFGGLISPYRVLTIFGMLYVLTLLMVKETVVTIRGIETFYQMRITTHYDFLGWDKVESMLCEEKKHNGFKAVYFTYGDRVKRLFFTEAEALQVMAFA